MNEHKPARIISTQEWEPLIAKLEQMPMYEPMELPEPIPIFINQPEQIKALLELEGWSVDDYKTVPGVVAGQLYIAQPGSNDWLYYYLCTGPNLMQRAKFMFTTDQP